MNIALIGYGKMGKAIETIAIEKGYSIGLKITSSTLDQLTIANLRQCDVAIEFTNPHSAVQNILTCFEAGIPVICGSTGWLAEWDMVKSKCEEKHGALLFASNFSIGVNIFFEVNKKLAQLMRAQPSYNVSIAEIHHTHKKDAPSGTAITLAEQVLSEVTRKTSWVNDVAAKDDELLITSQRIDPAPGTHTITYSSAIDDIEIKHTAHSRQGFASGAVVAAAFIKGKKGIFTMKDVLAL